MPPYYGKNKDSSLFSVVVQRNLVFKDDSGQVIRSIPSVKMSKKYALLLDTFTLKMRVIPETSVTENPGRAKIAIVPRQKL